MPISRFWAFQRCLMISHVNGAYAWAIEEQWSSIPCSFYGISSTQYFKPMHSRSIFCSYLRFWVVYEYAMPDENSVNRIFMPFSMLRATFHRMQNLQTELLPIHFWNWATEGDPFNNPKELRVVCQFFKFLFILTRNCTHRIQKMWAFNIWGIFRRLSSLTQNITALVTYFNYLFSQSDLCLVLFLQPNALCEIGFFVSLGNCKIV